MSHAINRCIALRSSRWPRAKQRTGKDTAATMMREGDMSSLGPRSLLWAGTGPLQPTFLTFSDRTARDLPTVPFYDFPLPVPF